MITLTRIELYKLFKSSRTYLTFGIAVVLMLVIDLGLYSDGEEVFAYLLQAISEYFYLEGNLVNGYLIAYLALNTLWVHLPILIVIVTAHIFAGEFEYGTIRLLLTQTPDRLECFVAKFIAMAIYILCFMLVVALAAILPSALIFGTGDVVVFMDGIQFLQEDSFLTRFFQTLGFATLGMLAFSSLTMLFALWFRNTLTAILMSLGILILLTLLQKFVFGVFSSWQPFLFSYHMSNWQLFFVNEIPYDAIFFSVLYLIVMIVVCFIVGLLKFKRMNITE